MSAPLPLGIMQGRLVPPETDFVQTFPRERWREEFPRAAAAGICALEWIYDSYGESANPLASDEGVAEMAALAACHGVAVRSLCADWLMEHPLVTADGTGRAAWVERLGWLVVRASVAGMRRIVLPFVDAAAIRDEHDERVVVDALLAVLPSAEAARVELHLETALGPEAFAALLARVPHPLVRANYDAGNSAALGYAPRHEFAAYGERVGSVHVKDRRRGGGTVPLGTGDADLVAVGECLRDVRYRGDVVLQVARGVPECEVAWATHNRGVIERLWREVPAWS